MVRLIIGCLAILVVLFAVVCGALFVWAMTRWNEEVRRGCDESQCDSCPFPCEKHDNNWKGRL